MNWIFLFKLNETLSSTSSTIFLPLFVIEKLKMSKTRRLLSQYMIIKVILYKNPKRQKEMYISEKGLAQGETNVTNCRSEFGYLRKI